MPLLKLGNVTAATKEEEESSKEEVEEVYAEVEVEELSDYADDEAAKGFEAAFGFVEQQT